MQKILSLFILIIGISFGALAQELSKEQVKAIELEQLKLKDGSITYDEFQKRVERIKKGENPDQPKQEEAKTPATPENKATPATTSPAPNTSPTVNETGNSTDKKTATDNKTVKIYTPGEETASKSNERATATKPVYNYNGLRPGDELMKFTKQFYLGMALTVISYGATIIGAIAMNIPNGGIGIGLFLMGGIGTLLGTTVTLSSFMHIKKAGQIMNQIDDQTKGR